MHEGQIALSDADAARLITRRFPEYRDEVVRRLDTAGTVNAIYRVGEVAAARFPLMPPDDATTGPTPAAEARAMAEFLEASPFPGPRPLGIGDPSDLYPGAWSLQTWLPGTTPTPRSHERSDAFADDLAELIATLRHHPTQGRRFSGPGRGGTLRDHERWIRECLERSSGLLDTEPLERMWNHFRDLPPADSDVMSHGDLIPANLLVDGDRLTGVLDTGGFGPADPALDLVAAWHLLDGPRRRRLRERLEVPAEEWDRGGGWVLVQAVGLVWYYVESNPLMAGLGRCVLTRLVGAGVGS